MAGLATDSDPATFRRRLNAWEDAMEQLRVNVAQQSAIVASLADAGAAFQASGHALADQLLRFGGDGQDPDLGQSVGPALVKFRKVLKDIESFREDMLVQIKQVLTVPMERFVEQEVAPAREMKKRVDLTSQQYKDALVNYLSVPTNADCKTAELQLAASRLNFEMLKFDMAAKTADLESKRRIDFLESLCACMYGQLTFFHQGYDLLLGLQPYLRNLQGRLQKAREGAAARAAAAAAERKSYGDSVMASCVPGGGVPAPESPSVAASSLAAAEAPLQQGAGAPASPAAEMQGMLLRRPRQAPTTKADLAYTRIRNGYLQAAGLKPINLMVCNVREAPASAQLRHCFELISPSESYLYQTETPAECDAWIVAIRNAIVSVLTNARQSPTVNSAALHSETGSSPSSSPRGPRRSDASPGGIDASPTTTRATFVTMLRQNKSNCICADCGAENPQWCALNLGVMICIECAGVHRSLGVHISKVRSLRLDDIPPWSLHLLKELGNDKVAKVLEANCPPDMTRPSPEDPRAVRELFIKRKYIAREGVALPTDAARKSLSPALYKAVSKGDAPTTLRLLLQGANPNWANPADDNKTAMHEAVSMGSFVIAELLFHHGADVCTADKSGWTPLHHAACNDYAECAHMLLSRGADRRAKDAEGKSPLAVARDCVSDSVAAILAEASEPGAGPGESEGGAAAEEVDDAIAAASAAAEAAMHATASLSSPPGTARAV